MALYSKTFTRDFCLPALEAWYRGEALNDKEWTNEKQKCFPYIIFERIDGTVNCYYDLLGVAWMKNLLLDKASKDTTFIPTLVTTIPEKLKTLRPIYEQQRTLDRLELITFITELEEYYPWFEAMWWLMEMSEEELQGLDVTSLRQVRKDTEKLSSGTNIVIRTSLEKIYPEIKEYVHVLRTSEIKSNRIPPLEELKKRDKNFFFTADKLFVGAESEEIEKMFDVEFEKIAIQNNVGINGQVACKGRVTGIVCRVMGHKDIIKIQEGQVLVSPMTMPDMLPAMQLASAFVTDEGGITCHAAIVAREMKKPCIIGTKIATQVLKDGDLVEVDADSGVVRVIERQT